MWWVAIPVAVGAWGLWKHFDDSAKAARVRWQNEHRNVKKTIKEHQRNIKQNIEKAQKSYNFHLLTDLHFSSMKVANHAYSLLNDSKTTLDAMGKMLVDAKKKRNELYKEKKNTQDKNRKKDIQKEIQLINDLRSQIFPDKDNVKQQRKDMLEEVKKLNHQTRNLKLAIRDRCGSKGRDWYNRLEARTQARRRR